jgi:hypothetical protein
LRTWQHSTNFTQSTPDGANFRPVQELGLRTVTKYDANQWRTAMQAYFDTTLTTSEGWYHYATYALIAALVVVTLVLGWAIWRHGQLAARLEQAELIQARYTAVHGIDVLSPSSATDGMAFTTSPVSTGPHWDRLAGKAGKGGQNLSREGLDPPPPELGQQDGLAMSPTVAVDRFVNV